MGACGCVQPDSTLVRSFCSDHGPQPRTRHIAPDYKLQPNRGGKREPATNTQKHDATTLATAHTAPITFSGRLHWNLTFGCHVVLGGGGEKQRGGASLCLCRKTSTLTPERKATSSKPTKGGRGSDGIAQGEAISNSCPLAR